LGLAAQRLHPFLVFRLWSDSVCSVKQSWGYLNQILNVGKSGDTLGKGLAYQRTFLAGFDSKSNRC